MSKLGEKIKEVRINEGLSQEEFAKELGYTSKSTINKIEKGVNKILRKGAGHVGYGILPEYRGKGYAKQGLLLAIEKCKELIKEDEIYLSVI